MRKLFRDDSGELDLSEIITVVVTVVIAGVLIGALLPTALNTNAVTTNTTTGVSYVGGTNVSGNGTSTATAWSSALLGTWGAVPILIAISGLLVFVAIIIRITRK